MLSPIVPDRGTPDQVGRLQRASDGGYSFDLTTRTGTMTQTISQQQFAELHQRVRTLAQSTPSEATCACAESVLWHRILSGVGAPVRKGRSWATEADRIPACDFDRAVIALDRLESGPALCAMPCPLGAIDPSKGYLPCLGARPGRPGHVL